MLPPIRLHYLRHGWATLALADGSAPEGRSGAPRSRHIRDHARQIQPRHARHARRRGRVIAGRIFGTARSDG